MKEKNGRKILYLIQLPPPFHGVSVMNRYVLSSEKINAGFETKLIQLRFSQSIQGLRRFSWLHLPRFLYFFFRLHWQLLFWRPDLVYFSLMPLGKGFIRDLCFQILIKTFCRRRLIHLHNRGMARNMSSPLYRFLYRIALNGCQVIHLTERMAEEELSWIRLKNTKVHIVPNTALIPPEKEKREHGSKLKLLFYSNLFPEKGLQILLEAFEYLRKDQGDLELHIYGEERNSGKQSISSLLGQTNLPDVYYHGPVREKEELSLFTKHDIFIFPSWFREECFPLVLLEAMAAGIPIISTGIGGIPEMLRHGKDAVLVEERNATTLAQAIKVLTADPQKRKTLAANAKKRFLEIYSFERFESRMREVFEHAFRDG